MSVFLVFYNRYVFLQFGVLQLGFLQKTQYLVANSNINIWIFCYHLWSFGIFFTFLYVVPRIISQPCPRASWRSFTYKGNNDPFLGLHNPSSQKMFQVYIKIGKIKTPISIWRIFIVELQPQKSFTKSVPFSGLCDCDAGWTGPRCGIRAIGKWNDLFHFVLVQK
jgi:hypothetical protein